MNRENTSKVFNNNAFYIAISIIAAIILWTYIAFINNDTISLSIRNAPVIVNGQETLEEKGLIATSISRDEINLTLSGSSNVVAKIPSSDVYVTIDLDDITKSGSSVGMYQLPYAVHFPGNINSSYVHVSSASVDYITVQVERIETKPIPVRTAYDAVIPEGYQAQPIELSQETITITGPESIVDSISSALVNVADIELTDSYSEDLPFIYLNSSDEQVTSDLVKADVSSIYVHIPVVMVKEVALDVEFTGKNSATDDNITYSIVPSKIEISGSPSRVKDIEKIIIATIDLTDFETELNQKFDITLQDGLDNASGLESADVSINIQGVETRTLTVNEFTALNVTEGYSANITTSSLEIVIRGAKDLIDNIKESDVNVKADVTSLRNATGTYTVPAVIAVGDGKGIDAIGNYTLTVTLTKD